MKRYETVSNGTTRNTSHLSVDLHNRTHRQIADMAEQCSMSVRQIIEIAMDQFWMNEFDMPDRPASIADVIDEYDGTAAVDHDGAHPAELAAFGAL